MTFDELYQRLLDEAVRGDFTPQAVPQDDPQHLEYLFHPEKYAPIWGTANCSQCDESIRSVVLLACLMRSNDNLTDKPTYTPASLSFALRWTTLM